MTLSRYSLFMNEECSTFPICYNPYAVKSDTDLNVTSERHRN